METSSSERYSEILRHPLPADDFVRVGLGALEADFREMALLALADWANCDVVSVELFSAVASLQRPSWGMWNGLLAALRNARRSALRSGDADQRRRIESAATFARILSLLDKPADPQLLQSLQPLGKLTRASLSGGVKLGLVLSMPITLRNRIAHDTPTDDAWWKEAADALRPLLQWHAETELTRVREPGAPLPSPWFYADEKETLAFNGVERDFAVLYTSAAGISRAIPARAHDMLQAFGKLLGKADAREKDFRKLLTKLAPQEIRGVIMGDWLVGPPVGEGGFAQVHLGRQLSTGRKAAIKILRDGMEPQTLQRFQQEAAFLSRFKHPNIVGVFGFGQETWTAPKAFNLAGEPWFDAFAKTAPVKTFIAMEWVEGRTLDDVFRAGQTDPSRRPPVNTLVEWMAQCAAALTAVHSAGLIHRDVKPQNLMVTGGALPVGQTQDQPSRPLMHGDLQVKLMDFGIARVQNAERTLVTESGRTLGTPAYMSPEQIRAGDAEAEVGPESDVYSLSATFYELITGRRMFDQLTVDQIRTAKVSGVRPMRPKISVGDLPWEIETILLGGLEPEPADRYRSMAALESDLRRYLADEPIEYRKPSLARRVRLLYRRNHTVANLIGVFLILTIAGVFSYISSIRTEQQRTSEQRDVAVSNGKLADEQRKIAIAKERESRLRLADLHARSGHKMLEEGDPSGALLWYLKVLPLLADAPDQDHLNRLRIGITLRQLPRPTNVLALTVERGKAYMTATLTADGTRLIAGALVARRDASNRSLIVGQAEIFDSITGSLLGTTESHEGFVNAVEASDNGDLFTTISQFGVARLYEKSGKLLGTFERPQGIERAGLSPHGRRLFLVSGSESKNFGLVDPESGKPIAPPTTFEQKVGSVAFSATSQSVIVASGDRVVALNASTGQPMAPPLMVPTVWQAVYSPDNRWIAVASGEGWARVYDSATGEPVTPQLMHAGPAVRVLFSPDGKRLATASSDHTARIWNLPSGKPATVALRHPETPYRLVFSADGRRLATIAYDKAVRIWDAESGRTLGYPMRQSAEIVDGAFARDTANRFEIVSSAGLMGWDFGRTADPGQVRVPAKRDISRAVFGNDSSWIVCNSAAGRVRVIDVNRGLDLVTPFGHPKSVSHVELSRDGKRLLTACADGAARIWDVSRIGRTTAATAAVTRPTSAEPALSFFHGQAVELARFNPTSTRVITIAGDDKIARLWNADNGSLVASLPHDRNVTDADFSPDNKYLATSAADGTARIWNAETGAIVGKPLKHETRAGAVSRVRFSPDSSLLLTASVGGPLKLWNVSTGSCQADAEPPSAPREINFSPDGSLFLAAGFSNFLNLYDTRTPALPTGVIAAGQVTGFGVFSPDGRAIYASSTEGRRLFDRSGTPIGPHLHRSLLGEATFSPNGRWLAMFDDELRIFDVSPEARPIDDLTKLVKLLSGRTLTAADIIQPLSSEEAKAIDANLRIYQPAEFAPSGQAHGN